MTDREIDEAFNGATQSWPLWQAFVELLQREVDDNMVDVTTAPLPDGLRHFHAGRLAQALECRNAINDRMEGIQRAKLKSAVELARASS